MNLERLSMKITNLMKRYNFEWCLTAFVFLIVCIFLISQPIQRHITINASTVLWIIGLLFLPTYMKNKNLKKEELQVYFLGAICFFISLASWLNSPYFDFTIKPIEPDARFLLFPLTIIAIQYSKITFKHFSIALILGSAAYTWVTYNSIDYRVRGDENAVTFGNGAMLLFITSTCLIFFEKNKILKLCLTVAALGYFYASYRSGTRGSFLAFIPLSLMSIYFLNKKQIIAALFALLTVGAIFSQTPIANGLIIAYQNTSNYIVHKNTASSSGQRLDMWQASWCFNKESPLLGKGPHQFKQAILDHKRVCQINMTNGKGYYVQAHSFYFNAIATIGWLGLISMLLFFIKIMHYSLSLPLIAKVTIPATIITFLSYSVTVDLLFQRYMADKHLTLLAILLGLALNHKKYIKNKTIKVKAKEDIF